MTTGYDDMSTMKVTLWNWLYRRPRVIRYTTADGQDIGPFLPDERVHRMQFYHWHYKPELLSRWHQEAITRRSQHRIYHCINDKRVAHACQALGMQAFHINHNLFLDERIFCIDRAVAKRYDAIYVARMHPQKRHELASQVRSCLMVGSVGVVADSADWRRKLNHLCPHARFQDYGDRKWLDHGIICNLMNQSRVGLCLSEIEGGMYVATEYLMCGLPVVTTGNLGGRNDWMDPDFTRVVPDSPQAVAEAVKDLISREIPAEYVRAETMRRINVHRERWCDLVQSVLDAEGAQHDFRRQFYGTFENKGGEWKDVAQVAQELPSAPDAFKPFWRAQ